MLQQRGYEKAEGSMNVKMDIKIDAKMDVKMKRKIMETNLGNN